MEETAWAYTAFAGEVVEDDRHGTGSGEDDGEDALDTPPISEPPLPPNVGHVHAYPESLTDGSDQRTVD